MPEERFPPIKCNNMSYVAIDEGNSKDWYRTLTQEYVANVRAVLTNPPFNYDELDTAATARSVIMEGGNCDGFGDNTGVIGDNPIADLQKDYQCIRRRSALFLTVAPPSGQRHSRTPGAPPLPPPRTTAARDEALLRRTLSVPSDIKRIKVECHEDVRNDIAAYIRYTRYTSLQAMIVILGGRPMRSSRRTKRPTIRYPDGTTVTMTDIATFVMECIRTNMSAFCPCLVELVIPDPVGNCLNIIKVTTHRAIRDGPQMYRRYIVYPVADMHDDQEEGAEEKKKEVTRTPR